MLSASRAAGGWHSLSTLSAARHAGETKRSTSLRPPLLARYRGLRGPYVDKLIPYDVAQTPNDYCYEPSLVFMAAAWPLLCDIGAASLALSGGLLRSLAACCALWRPLALFGALWRPLAAFNTGVGHKSALGGLWRPVAAFGNGKDLAFPNRNASE